MNSKMLLVVAPWLLAGGALAAVAVQAGSVSSLEARVAQLETSRDKGPKREAPQLRPEVLGQPAPTAAVAPGDGGQVAALSARLDELERRAAKAPVAAARPLPGAPGEVVADDVAALRADVDTLLTGDNFDSADTKQKLLGIVEQAVEERRARFEKAREEATMQRVADFAAEAGLDEKTTTALGELTVALRGSRRQVMERVQSGELDMREARAEAQAQQETVRTQIKDLLGPGHYAAYEEQFPERGGRWGGGGDGRGGRGGGGGR